ncbi:MAG: hypothetical protein JWM78_554 [Verrucomicrobiaceae bacterium]|nr:hypothetical protein [Verrucomicrobiaceae bacterium]
MLSKLKAFFSEFEEQDSHSEQQLQIAAAALLIELSKADFARDPREQAAIIAAVGNCYGLEESAVKELLQEAENASAKATSLYEFTRVINSQCSDTEKFKLVCELWRVANADRHIDKYEDHLIRQIADLIYLPHSEYIRAKLEILNAPDAS